MDTFLNEISFIIYFVLFLQSQIITQ